MTHFCGEITYETPDGNVHSDICFNCSSNNDVTVTPLPLDYRKFIHTCLDEWLNKSNGSGAFWLGNPEYFRTWEKE